MAKGNFTTSKAQGANVAKATNEPLLPLWRTVRAAWAAHAADEDDNGPTVKAYRAAFAAFDKVKPTTTLGLFLTLLHSDDGDDFADRHPAAADAMIAQLEAANVSLRSLAKTKKGDAA
jgi:hypothetical protein